MTFSTIVPSNGQNAATNNSGSVLDRRNHKFNDKTQAAMMKITASLWTNNGSKAIGPCNEHAIVLGVIDKPMTCNDEAAIVNWISNPRLTLTAILD